MLVGSGHLYDRSTNTWPDSLGLPIADGRWMANGSLIALTTNNTRSSLSRLSGSLDTAASTRYRIDVYANDAADPSAHGEGHTPVGAFEVVTDAGRVAYGPVQADDVAGLFDAAFLHGAQHALGHGLTEKIPYLAKQSA